MSALLLDGAVGVELRRRAQAPDGSLWPAEAMRKAPEMVTAVHEDYLRAGADAITTNSYALVEARLKTLTEYGEEWESMLALSGRLAAEARDRVSPNALVMGALPPLHGSYRPEDVGDVDAITSVYAEHCRVLAPYIDVILCETMSTAAEGRAAVSAAQALDKPIWCSWTIADDASALLRSGETLDAAAAALDGLAVDGLMVNCSSPESVAAALPHLKAAGAPRFGGYANGFNAIPKGWKVAEKGMASLGKREDLTPDAYADHALAWIEAGAGLVGGCCETGPAHIRRIAERLGKPTQEAAAS